MKIVAGKSESYLIHHFILRRENYGARVRHNFGACSATHSPRHVFLCLVRMNEEEETKLQIITFAKSN